jgi:hypothetical protein
LFLQYYFDITVKDALEDIGYGSVENIDQIFGMICKSRKRIMEQKE